jgi:release factor glutamine methyltransferase
VTGPRPEPSGTVGGLLCRAGQHLRAAGIESPRFEARLLLAHALGCGTDDLFRDPRAMVPPAAAQGFRTLIERRLRHEPIAHLVGTRGFWLLDVEVSPATLIPRPDTETLIEAALDARPDRQAVHRVLDLGTGTGCLLLAALREFPNARGIGVDLAPGAAALARRNAERARLGHRARFLAGDWSQAIGPQVRFDLILSNPPYIATDEIARLMPEVAWHEPRLALDGGADGLAAYRALIPCLASLLAPDTGRAVIELGAGQRPPVEAMARNSGLATVTCRTDLGGVERALVLRLGGALADTPMPAEGPG